MSFQSAGLHGVTTQVAPDNLPSLRSAVAVGFAPIGQTPAGGEEESLQLAVHFSKA
jgi:hypothetical protein